MHNQFYTFQASLTRQFHTPMVPGTDKLERMAKGRTFVATTWKPSTIVKSLPFRWCLRRMVATMCSSFLAVHLRISWQVLDPLFISWEHLVWLRIGVTYMYIFTAGVLDQSYIPHAIGYAACIGQGEKFCDDYAHLTGARWPTYLA